MNRLLLLFEIVRSRPDGRENRGRGTARRYCGCRAFGVEAGLRKRATERVTVTRRLLRRLQSLRCQPFAHARAGFGLLGFADRIRA